MKCKLLEQLWYMTKIVFYGTFMQCILFSFLVAEDISAQRKSIDEIYLKVDLQNSSIKHALKVIEKETGLYFAYADVSIDQKVKIDHSSQEASLRDLLSPISMTSDLQFKRVNETINISKKSNGHEAVTEIITITNQVRALNGNITSSEDQMGLPGCTLWQGTR